MNGRIVALMLCLLAGNTDRPVPNPAYFRYQRALRIPSGTAPQQTCVPIDTNVFKHAVRGLADVRIFQAHREVPYALYTGLTVSPSAFPAPTLLNLGERGGQVVFDAHVSHPSYRDIEMLTAAHDFVGSVVVSGSQTPDAAGATQLGTFTIFDLTRQQQMRSMVLHLPASTFPYLHFTVSAPIKPSDVTGVAVLAVPERPPVYHTIADVSRIIQQEHQSVIRVTVPSKVPVEHVEIVPTAAVPNFRRGITVDATPRDGLPSMPMSGTVFRIHTTQGDRQIDDERYALDLPPSTPLADTTRRQWTVSIDNGDDAPLPLASIRLAMNERLLCFDAGSADSYTMYYGDSTLSAPRYDYATLFRLDERPHHAQLEAEQLNSQVRPRPDARPLTERYPALLWITLVVVVAVLGTVAVRSAHI